MTRVVLIHGAATDQRVWQATAAALTEHVGVEVLAPTRPQSGDLDREIAFLQPLCAGAFVVGVSGGATLGLELAARGTDLLGGVFHEPAAGSLAPGLLSHVAAALATAGTAGFGKALYGQAWTPESTEASLATIEREFAMFGAFEPSHLPADHAQITLTVGKFSPEARYSSVAALSAFLGVPWRILPGVSHAAHLEGGFLDAKSSLPELLEVCATSVGSADGLYRA